VVAPDGSDDTVDGCAAVPGRLSACSC